MSITVFCTNSGTEEEAAEAYDIAAIKFRGLNAVTNFDMNRYDVKSILESNSLPIGGGAAKRLKEAQAIESSRKREEMLALGSAFHYGSSSTGTVLPLQAYHSLMQQPYDQQPQPLLTLQPEISQYSQEHQFNHSYIQTQLQLHQQSAVDSYNNSQLYNSYLQNNPSYLHGFMNMGSSSSVLDNNGSSSNGSFSTGGYLGHSTAGNGGSGVGGSSTEELGMVKVDYDMPSGSYTTAGWSGDSSVQGSNPGVFSMWND